MGWKPTTVVTILGLMGILFLFFLQQGTLNSAREPVPDVKTNSDSVTSDIALIQQSQKLQQTNGVQTKTADQPPLQAASQHYVEHETVTSGPTEPIPQLSEHPTMKELKEFAHQRAYQRALKTGRLDEFNEREKKESAREEERNIRKQNRGKRREALIQWQAEMREWQEARRLALEKGLAPPPRPERPKLTEGHEGGA